MPGRACTQCNKARKKCSNLTANATPKNKRGGDDAASEASSNTNGAATSGIRGTTRRQTVSGSNAPVPGSSTEIGTIEGGKLQRARKPDDGRPKLELEKRLKQVLDEKADVAAEMDGAIAYLRATTRRRMTLKLQAEKLKAALENDDAV